MAEAHRMWLKDGFHTPGEQSKFTPFVGKRKLNLGCGRGIEPVWTGWINADINKASNAQVIFDARKSWPIRDGSLDTVLAWYVLQNIHGEQLFQTVYNIGTALKLGGHLIACVPFGATGDPMQLSFWQDCTPRLFDRRIYKVAGVSTYGNDQGLPMVDWDLVHLEVSPSVIQFVMRKAKWIA